MPVAAQLLVSPAQLLARLGWDHRQRPKNMPAITNVTLIGMDCIDPERTIKAMQFSMLQARFERAVLITSKAVFHPDMLKTIGGQGRLKIEPHFTVQGRREDYERAIICELPVHFDTSHCLFMEWDSGILNPTCFSNDWLYFDYIGAPWPHAFNERGYPPCTEANCVGNGGFSLRSHERRLDLPDSQAETGASGNAVCRRRTCRVVLP
jgi:hypothetical protein